MYHPQPGLPSIALLFMRVLSVSWSSYTIWRTLDIHRRLDHLVSDPDDSACRFDLFHGYIPFRIALQVCLHSSDPEVQVTRPGGVWVLPGRKHGGLCFNRPTVGSLWRRAYPRGTFRKLITALVEIQG